MTDKRPYEVGYGRPPKRTRFKPGQSGNPKGRPKRSRNRLTILGDELSQRVVINEQGQRRTISKSEVILRQMVNKSAAGDLKATAMVLENWARLEEREKELDAATAHPAMSEADSAVMQILAARMRKAAGGQNETD